MPNTPVFSSGVKYIKIAKQDKYFKYYDIDFKESHLNIFKLPELKILKEKLSVVS